MTTGADVQIESGNWSKVHNVILEQLAKANLNGRESKCLFFLLRMTYGNQCKEREISLSLWAEGTNIDKRHVKPIVDGLIDRNIIYRVDGKRGRGNTALYGFNKYFEGWDKTTEKVPSTVPIKKVPDSVPFIEPVSEEKVPSTVPEKVPSTVPIKERSKAKAAALPVSDETNQVTSLVLLAYNTVGRIAPSQYRDDGKANLIIASELIELYGWQACVRGVSTLKERNSARVLKNARDTIRAPVSYLRTIMESEQQPQVATVSVLDFSVGEYT